MKKKYLNINKFKESLDSIIRNKDIYEMMIDEINYYLKNPSKKIIIKNNKLIGKSLYKDNLSTLLIEINNNNIYYRNVGYKGIFTKTISIYFNKNKTIYTKEILEKTLNDSTLEVEKIERNYAKNVYIDNKLNYKIKTTKKVNINSHYISTIFSELYIDNDNKALLKEIIMNNNQNSRTIYKKIDKYECEIFNTKDHEFENEYYVTVDKISESEYENVKRKVKY